MNDVLVDSLANKSIDMLRDSGLPDLISFLIVIIIIAMVTAGSTYLGSYLYARGRNLATKKDLDEITRLTESIKSEFLFQVEELKSEYDIIKRSHELFVENSIEYYSMLYDHVLRCSRVATYDIHVHRDGKTEDVTELFLTQLRDFADLWNAQLGRIAVLMPAEIIEKHEEIQAQFNEFRDIVMNRESYLIDGEINEVATSSKYKKELTEILVRMQDTKSSIENMIRGILRVNKISPNDNIAGI